MSQEKTARQLSFRALPPQPLLPADEIAHKYPRLRLQVFMGIFIGYAGFYLVRNNISPVAALIKNDGILDTVAIGIIANAVYISYGLSKFMMATLSDRANARLFMPLGLALSGITNILLGTIPALHATVAIFTLVMFINGWFQGMGWPPSGRALVHWFSTTERGWKTAIWNCAHNVGGAGVGISIAWALSITGNQWQSAFWLPGIISLIVALIAFLLIRDTPESEGLPPIEEYRNDPAKTEAIDDSEIANQSTFTIIWRHILTNRVMVLLALANIFIYVLRYGILSWTPVYLHDIHGASLNGSIAGFSTFEIAGIIGTLICGWVTDKIFRGYRTSTGILFLGAVALCTLAYWLVPHNSPLWIPLLLVSLIGGLIYGPVMLIGLQAIDLAPRNIAGTAAGFTGLMGYVVGATLASTGIGFIIKHWGWNVTFIFLLVCAFIAIALIAGVGKDEKLLMEHHSNANSTTAQSNDEGAK
ncbi:MFS transporter [Corynebacterium pseudokroppenstedtii]|uniref:MFS transporter n=1 Tax=Corynebacterium pseudokroppenstedtii TaxID=2804917 RepID=A0AAU0Q016_9CORY|nr:MFS transporter [Corynebacterium pseudokroppenstedtii]MCF6794409.1 MFS transporter [Corynebacterium pseudokroppenstedtii]MCF8704016.1 MFS transporter [Corynebacterium pseudokroppenstedtii]MCG2637523.1 MFS transporter [Corynebacterium pseudokroppenstedtii]MDK7148500.1 MFS transporter [Corynebacterium pseudokroppenstedtii]